MLPQAGLSAFNRFNHRWLALALAIFLAACSGGDGGGGGGNGGGNNAPVELSFADKETAKLVVGDRFRKPISVPSNNDLTFVSNNTEVAEVNNQGVVTAKASGSAVITATLGGQQASYSVDIIPKTVMLTAFVGDEESELSLTDGNGGSVFMPEVAFLASSDSNCNFDNDLECLDNLKNFNITKGDTINSKAATAKHPGYFQLRYGDRVAEASIDVEEADVGFFPRDHHHVVAFKGRLWLMGGDVANAGGVSNDIWSSADGRDWVLEKKQAAFSPRSSHQVAAFDDGTGDKLWLVGGYPHNGNGLVWTSENGQDWDAAPEPDFSNRYFHQMVTFDDQLWVIGGYRGGTLGDIWSLGKGSDTWTNRTNEWLADARPPARDGFQAVVFEEQLWVIGGAFDTELFQQNYLNDVWVLSKKDAGAVWKQLTFATEAVFTPRGSHQVAELNGQLWLFGGLSGSGEIETDSVVWSLTQGSDDTWSWTDRTSELSTAFTPRHSHQVVTFNNALWLIGGHDGKDRNDILKSTDGLNWQQRVQTEFTFPNITVTP